MSTIANGGSDTFVKYLRTVKDQVRKDSSDGYYHVNIVADAYSQGYTDGQQSGKKDFVAQILKDRIERFTQKANQVYILTSRLISHLNDEKYEVISFHIDPNLTCPRSLIVVETDVLNNDSFVEIAYSKIFSLKKVFNELFQDNLDMSIVGNENIEYDLLKKDGFGYTEVIKKKPNSSEEIIADVEKKKPRRKK